MISSDEDEIDEANAEYLEKLEKSVSVGGVAVIKFCLLKQRCGQSALQWILTYPETSVTKPTVCITEFPDKWGSPVLDPFVLLSQVIDAEYN